MPNFLPLIQLRLTMRYNKFIAALQKIPLLGRLVSDKAFQARGFKGLMAFFGGIQFIWSQVFQSVLYFGFIGLMGYFLHKVTGLIGLDLSASRVMVLFACSFVFGSFISNVDVYEPSQEAALCIKIYGLDPKKYYQSLLFLDLPDPLFYILALAISLKLMGLSPWGGLPFGLALEGIRGLVRYLCLKDVAKRESMDLSKRSSTIFFWFLGGTLLTLGLLILIHWLTGLNLVAYVLTWPAGLVGLGLCFLSYRMTYRGDLLYRVSQRALNAKMAKNDVEIDAAKIMMELDDKDLDLSRDKKFDQFHGVAYINEIFYHRLSRRFFKMVRVRFIILGLAVLVLLGLSFFFKTEILQAMKKDHLDLNDGLLKILPAVIIYMSSLIYVSESLTKLSFYHLDRTLMGDPLYRSPRLVVYSLKVRLKKVLKMNLPLIGLVYLFTLGLRLVFPQIQVKTLVVLLAWETLLMLFFSLYYLYMYYLIQPFTVDMKVKSPLYNFLQVVIVFFSYQSMSVFLNMDNPLPFYLGLAAFFVLFTLLGYFAVLRLAPKNFKLRHG